MLDSSRKETPSSAVLSLTLICALLLVGLLHSALSLPALLASAFGGLAVMLFLRYRHLERELRQLRQRELERADPGGDPLAQARNCCKTYRDLVENANSIIIRWDRTGTISYANDYALRFFGYERPEFIGANVLDTIVPRTESTGRNLEAMIDDISHNPENYRSNENENICRDRRRVWVSWTNKAIRDDSGRTVEVLSVGNDMTEKRQYERRIHHLAHYDEITSLPNRRLFWDQIAEAISATQPGRGEFALIYLDLNRFQHINDSQGHQRGDRLLRLVAERLPVSLGTSDTLARLGSDEFALLLRQRRGRQEAREAALATAMAVESALSAPLTLDGQDFYLTASMGIVTYPTDGLTAAELIQHAHTAMYQAKAMRNRNFALFDAAMSAEALARLQLETALRTALLRDALELHYQPALNLKTLRIDYVEALLRWNDAELGAIPATRLVEIAEDCGLMPALGNWVLRTATRQAAAWDFPDAESLLVAVNLSPRQLEHRDLVSDVRQALAESGLPAPRLALEITESTLMGDSEHAQRALQEISAMGVTLLIDDFGTGYSSLARLRELPINTVKIDRSFVVDLMAGEAAASEIIDAIIAMAHNLGLQVIAEGVENIEQMRYLARRNCDHIQGFLVAEALEPSQLAQLLDGEFSATSHLGQGLPRLGLAGQQ